jgi:hypothetical protein
MSDFIRRLLQRGSGAAPATATAARPFLASVPTPPRAVPESGTEQPDEDVVPVSDARPPSPLPPPPARVEPLPPLSVRPIPAPSGLVAQPPADRGSKPRPRPEPPPRMKPSAPAPAPRPLLEAPPVRTAVPHPVEVTSQETRPPAARPAEKPARQMIVPLRDRAVEVIAVPVPAAAPTEPAAIGAPITGRHDERGAELDAFAPIEQAPSAPGSPPIETARGPGGPTSIESRTEPGPRVDTRTLSVPSPPARAGRSVEIHIGTIEVRVPALPPAAPPPAPKSVPGGFEEHSALRSYASWPHR